MSTFGTQTAYGVPILHVVTIDAVQVGDNEQFRISDVSNSSDPINNKRKISDLTLSFVDLGSSIWATLGNGTGGFNKDVVVTTYIGGTMGYTTSDVGTSWERQSLLGANSYTTHKGKIVNVSRAGRVTTIRSQNQMNLLPKLLWQHPVKSAGRRTMGSFYEKFSFISESETETMHTDIKTNSGWDFNEDKSQWKLVGYPNDAKINIGLYPSVSLYDTTDGTGITGFLASNYDFVDSFFSQIYEPLQFKGTKLGTFYGTIDTEDKAKRAGYASLEIAGSNVNRDSTGTYWKINRIRFEWPGTANAEKPIMHQTQNMRMQGDPTAILRHLLFGKMVTNYFLQNQDEDTTSFVNAAKITAFQTYDQNIISKFNAQPVEPFINDALRTTSALFFMDTTNKFRFSPYGPLDFSQTIDALDTSNIIEASYTNDINDWTNRVEIKYGLDMDTGEYANTTMGTLSGWSIANDRPLEIESQWTKNANQANLIKDRFLSRFKNTVPKIKFTTSLQEAGRELGSLVTITETDTGMVSQKVQLVGYSKGFSSSKKVKFDALDGESLFNQRGYASWEGDNDLDAPVGPPLPAEGTSTSGWVASGTVLVINETKYGTAFNWW